MRIGNVIPAGDWGFLPVETLQREQVDQKTTRIFRGTGTNFIPVPGCLRVDAVRVGPMPQQPEIVFEMPTDITLSRLQAFGHQGWRLLDGLDGVSLLERTVFSNIGIWQKDVEIFITGEWDLSLSPIPEPEAPSDLVISPMATEPAPRRGPGRPSNAAIAARETGGGPP